MICLNNSYVKYDGNIYLQTKGAPMGPNFASNYANLEMLVYDNLITANKRVKCYFRLLDDIFLFWDGKEKQWEKFYNSFDKCDNLNPNIHFTYKRTVSNS